MMHGLLACLPGLNVGVQARNRAGYTASAEGAWVRNISAAFPAAWHPGTRALRGLLKRFRLLWQRARKV